MAKLTRKYLREILGYDPASGVFTWLKRRGRVHVGMIAGRFNSRGRRQITIDGKQYLSSRLAVLWMTGRWPKKQVDHKDLNNVNDRWLNLRHATASQNVANQRLRADNKTGFKGVTRSTTCNRYAANIRKDGVRKFLGSFKTPELAHAAYKRAARKVFGRFARFS